MDKTLEEIRTSAIGVRNESAEGGITAMRLGNLYIDIIDAIEETNIHLASKEENNYVTKIYAGISGDDMKHAATLASENAAYIKLYDDTIYRNQVKIYGNGGTSIIADGNGGIKISSPDHKNATQQTAGLMSAADKKKLDGIVWDADNKILTFVL